MPLLARQTGRALAVLLFAGSIALLAACTAAPLPTVEPTATPAATEVLPTRRPTRPGPTPVTGVTIEVTGRTVHTTTKPNNMVRVSITDAPLEVRVHYPGSLEGEPVDAKIIQPSSVSWAISIMEQPDPNTFAIGLLGYEPGLITVQTTAGQYAPVRFSVQATVPTPGPEGTPAAAGAMTPMVGTSVPTAGSITGGQLSGSGTAAATPAAQMTVAGQGQTVTLDDNQKTITLHIGDRFLLNLGDDFDWSVTPADPAVLSRVPGVLTIRGSQGLYEARAVGQTALTAIGDPTCRKAQPPCAAPSRQFQIQVIVQ